MQCYLCRQTDFRVRPGAVRDDASLQILECSRCGLVTLSSLDHIKAGHYENSGMHAAEVSEDSMESWLRETEHDDQRRFDSLKALMVNRRVLDFGCGAAGFVRKASALAASVAGVEPERRVRDYWGDAIRLYADLDEAVAPFDLITAFHVVEHLADPRSVLANLAGRLSAGGRMVVEVPSADDALLTLYKSDAFQRFTYWSQHLFLFNAETMSVLAQQVGLRVVSIQQHQRYSVANHLHWLSQSRPGGHARWSFLDTPALNEAYAASLAAVGKCDTIIAHLERA